MQSRKPRRTRWGSAARCGCCKAATARCSIPAPTRQSLPKCSWKPPPWWPPGAQWSSSAIRHSSRPTIERETPNMKRHEFKSTRRGLGFRPGILAGAIGLALAAQQVHAIDLSTDEVEIRLDTTVSYGAGMRVSERDDGLVAKAHFDPVVSQRPLDQQIAAKGRFSANSDDGNLNFDQWDLIF